MNDREYYQDLLQDRNDIIKELINEIEELKKTIDTTHKNIIEKIDTIILKYD